MNHKQILEKLSAKVLVEAMDEDLSQLTFEAMCFRKEESSKNQLAYILPKLLLRWDCILKANAGVTETYKQITWLALAVTLHKYGFVDNTITTNAIKSIDKLNKEVVLSDDFFRKSEQIKEFISSPPIPLKRKPATPKSITFHRAGDVVSIQLETKYYAAYIHKIDGGNKSPIIELYDGVFDTMPNLEDLKNRKARGQKYNDGSIRISMFLVSGMKHIPDPANQIHVIESSVKEAPSNKHLASSIGLYAMSNLFSLQSNIQNCFK